MVKARFTSVLLIMVFSVSLIAGVGCGNAQASPTILEVQPSSVAGYPGDTFTVNITVSHVVDLYAYEFELCYPRYRSVLKLINVEQGDFFETPAVFFDYKDKWLQGILYVGAIFCQGFGVSGSGTLVRITFLVVEAGEGALKLTETMLANSQLQLILHQTRDGYYTGPSAELIHARVLGRRKKVGDTQQFDIAVRNRFDVPLYVYVLWEIVRLEDGAHEEIGSGQWWYGFGQLPDPWWIDPLECDGYYVHWAEGYLGVYWNYVGSPAWLDAIGDGNYIWADETQDAAMSAAYTFEDISLDPKHEINRVVLEGYTHSTNINIDLDVYTVSPTVFDWLGSLWGTTTWGWHTPRWIGQTAGEVVPGLLTEAGLNSVELVAYHYAPDPLAFAGVMTADEMRLQVELKQLRFYPEEPPVYVIPPAPSPEEPMELELDPATMGPLTADDVGTYICSATLYYSYYGTWFNPASKVQTLTWWVVQV